MSSRNITLAGSLGSGKSTVGKILAERLQLEFISTGMIFRSIGKVSDLDALQTNLAAETNTDIDAQVDSFIVERARSPQPFIMDSRMAWHFVPDSWKIYLYASMETSAQRILGDRTRDTESYANRDEAIRGLVQRRQSEVERYRKLYGVDIEDQTNYDLIIVTDGASPSEIADEIVRQMSSLVRTKTWIKKSQLVPLMTIRELSNCGPEDLKGIFTGQPIELVLSCGFGFVFEEPLILAAWLREMNVFCPFESKLPSYLRPDQDLFDLAKKFSRSHYYDWEEISGVRLKICDLID